MPATNLVETASAGNTQSSENQILKTKAIALQTPAESIAPILPTDNSGFGSPFADDPIISNGDPLSAPIVPAPASNVPSPEYEIGTPVPFESSSPLPTIEYPAYDSPGFIETAPMGEMIIQGPGIPAVEIPLGSCSDCPPGAATCGPIEYPMQEVVTHPRSMSELYPDEYICDGGDAEGPVFVRSDRSLLDLDPEDTIGHYNEASGEVGVAASNRVCIYAPRFAAVRHVLSRV